MHMHKIMLVLTLIHHNNVSTNPSFTILTKVAVIDANKLDPLYPKNTVHFPLIMHLQVYGKVNQNEKKL